MRATECGGDFGGEGIGVAVTAIEDDDGGVE